MDNLMKSNKGNLLDKFGNSATLLKAKKLFLLDMDGTIYMEDRLFDGALDFINFIKESGGNYVFITNNSSKSVKDYITKLNNMGIPSGLDNFFTSTQATILYLKEHYPDKTIYCMGTKSFVAELKEGGLKTVTEFDETAEVILVGYDTELTYEKLVNTCRMLKRDIPYIAANPDLTCPVSFGYVPDCGAMCEALEHATGKSPIYIGKPSPLMIDYVIKKFKYQPEDAVIIGDRLYTDIAAGNNAGITSICVLTGEATMEDIITGDIKPTYVFDSVKDIYNCL